MTKDVKADKPLTGWRVLVPRGGPWGDNAAALLRNKGAIPVVSPLINFAPPEDSSELERVIAELSIGRYDWLTVTSATTVDVLHAYGAKIPSTTKVAAVGETTAAALAAVGYPVDLVPEADNSATGVALAMIGLEKEPVKVLSLRSELAKPELSVRLADAGHDVTAVVAYRTVGVPATERAERDVNNGRINAILVTSGSVAEQVRAQFPSIPDQTVIAAIGPRTAQDSRDINLPIRVIAPERTIESLIEALSEYRVPEPTTAALQVPPTDVLLLPLDRTNEEGN